MLRHLAVTIALTLTVASCGSPTVVQNRRRVTSERAPLLPEAEDDERALGALYTGDVIEVLRTWGPLSWANKINGEPFKRSGSLLEVKRDSGGPTMFMFADDLKEEIKVPSEKWICEQMKGGPRCEGLLRRIFTGGQLIAYEACNIGPCLVGVVGKSSVSAISLDGLQVLAPAVIDGQPVVLASTRWVKSPTWTGQTTYVLRVGDTLKRSLTIVTDEVDTRAAPSIQRQGKLTVENGVLMFRGARHEVTPSTGTLLTNTPLVETYHLAK